MIEEQWRDIKGFEGYYQVSNTGKVKSLINRYKNTKKIFELKQETSTKYGHKRVQLSKPTKARKLVHRLVAEAFIPNPDNKPQVSHLDHDGSNNNVNNLAWETQSENLKHAQKFGRLKAAQSKGGTNNGIRLREESIKKAKSFVGQKFNDWEVIEFVGLKRYDSNENHLRAFVLCKCKCGFKQEKYIGYLNRMTCCSKCSRRKRKGEDIV